jgi:malonyl CoA-acyl carrier protein transacylase
MPTALLFPGQGSQVPGMRDLVAAEAPELLSRIGDEPFDRVAESTRFAQPAIFCASVAGWRVLEREGVEPVAAAGHSLGELAALVAAGAVDAVEALDLVVLRGRLMSEAAGGTMLALLGIDDDRAAELARQHGVTVANLNAPGQVVLSGDPGALRAVAARDGVRSLELGVAGAFHSPAMQPAVAPFSAALRATAWRPPAFPVVSCTTAESMTDPARELAEALTRPVRWTDTMRALAALGAAAFVDAGPGRVLAKLVRRTLPEAAHA